MVPGFCVRCGTRILAVWWWILGWLWVYRGGSLSGKEKRGQVASVGDLKRLRRNVYSDCGDVAVTQRGVE